MTALAAPEDPLQTVYRAWRAEWREYHRPGPFVAPDSLEVLMLHVPEVPAVDPIELAEAERLERLAAWQEDLKARGLWG